MIFENATIVFKPNKCYQLIIAEIEVNLYPFRLFQYFTKYGSTAKVSCSIYNKLTLHLLITFRKKYQTRESQLLVTLHLIFSGWMVQHLMDMISE